MTAAASLHGQRILVTRPQGQQASLSAAITRLGGKPVALPLITISLIRNPKAQERLQDRIQKLDQFGLIIFISTNAVQFGADLINSYWPRFPAGVKVLAIGPSTAAAAEHRLGCTISHSESGMNSEAVLELPQLQDLGGERIAIFRGEGGRELLAETLRRRGAEVDYLEVYRREPTSYDTDVVGEILAKPGLDILVLTSGESLTALLNLAAEYMARLVLLPLVVPSERVAELARKAGFQNLYVAQGANDEALLQAFQKIALGADNKA